MKKVDKLIIGTQYYRAPLPLRREWESDIKNIKKTGMNTVKIFAQWRWHERIRTRFVWDDIDELFSLCEKNGLLVHINIVLDVAPDWLFRNGRGIKMDNVGQIMYPKADGARYIGGWEPCFDDPAVRKEAARFLKAIINRYKNSRIFTAWDIWNEARSRPLGDCACQESRQRYREWLKNQYQSIEELNSFWGKAWTDWEDINPPPALGDYAEMYLWRQWAMHSVADRIAWAYKIAKSLDKKHPVMTHVGFCSVTQDVLNDTCDDWLVSREVDFYGSSLVVDKIPAGFLHRTMPGFHADWLKSLSPYFWINEFYPNKSGWEEIITPRKLYLRLWATIACGAKGIILWQYRCEREGTESNGHGLVDINGRVTERTKAFTKILKVVQKHADTINDLEPCPAEVALVYDQKSDLISRLECVNEFADFDKQFPYYHDYKASLQGSYALFWENNIPVDFVSIHEINKIHSYKAVYLPVPYIIDKNMEAELVKFVKKGGTLISEASAGLRQENTWVNPVNPSGKLRDLFGGIEEYRTVMEKVLKVSLPLYKISVPATRVMTHIQTEKGRACGFWSNKKTAAVINRYGQGQAILLGFFPGAAYVDKADKSLVRFIRLLMGKININPPVEIKGIKGQVNARILQKDGKKLLFLFNYGRKPEKIRLKSKAVSNFINLNRTSETEKTKSGIRVSIPAGEVALLLEA